eukprot:5878470-Pyramimonas_sp.AAC.2
MGEQHKQERAEREHDIANGWPSPPRGSKLDALVSESKPLEESATVPLAPSRVPQGSQLRSCCKQGCNF